MNCLTIYQAIFTSQQLCLDAFATPCRSQQNHSGSVRCIVSVFHLQVGQYYSNRIITAVNNLDFVKNSDSRNKNVPFNDKELMNALLFMLILQWLYYKPYCYTGQHYRSFTMFKVQMNQKILSSENDGLSNNKVPCIKKRA